MFKKTKQLRLIDMPLYRYWQALYLSFYSGRLYVDVAKRWRGFGITYLVFIIGIASIPLAIRVIANFNHYFAENMLVPLQTLPVLYVQNGEISFDKPMPYQVKNAQGEIISIIDTTGATTGISTAYPALKVLITKHKIYLRVPKFSPLVNDIQLGAEDKVYAYPLNKTDNEVFVGSEWINNSGIIKIKYLTAGVMYPLITIFLSAMYGVSLLMLACLGQLCAYIFFKIKLRFKEACRLLVVAATPQTSVLLLTFTINYTYPGLGFICLVVLALYFFYALFWVKRARNQMVQDM